MPADVRAALIGATFGLAYVLGNAGTLPATDRTILDVVAVAGYLVLVVLLGRSGRRGVQDGSTPTRRGFGRRYLLVVLAEVVVGVAGLLLVPHLVPGPRAALAWVTLVVGLHFFGLGAVWHLRFFHLLGTLVSLCGLAGLVLSAEGAREVVVAAVAGLLPGLLLLVSSARVLRNARPPVSAEASSAR